MNVVPVDPNVFDKSVMAVIGVEPVLDFDTEAQKVDRRTNAPKWRLQLLYKAPTARKPEVVEVGFATDEVLDINPTDRPVFTGLVARHWENTNEYGTSSGLSLSAEAITFRSAPSASRKPVEAAA
ncbi:MAG: hypothetical protein AAGA65_30005 [Actinomycetota bacterium]